MAMKVVKDAGSRVGDVRADTDDVGNMTITVGQERRLNISGDQAVRLHSVIQDLVEYDRDD